MWKSSGRHKHNQQTCDVSKSLKDRVLLVLTPTHTYPCTPASPWQTPPKEKKSEENNQAERICLHRRDRQKEKERDSGERERRRRDKDKQNERVEEKINKYWGRKRNGIRQRKTCLKSWSYLWDYWSWSVFQKNPNILFFFFAHLYIQVLITTFSLYEKKCAAFFPRFHPDPFREQPVNPRKSFNETISLTAAFCILHALFFVTLRSQTWWNKSRIL